MRPGDLWRRIGARVPVIQAPMAGAGGVALAAGVIAGGGVGSLPGAMVEPAALVAQAAAVRARASGPLALNFFCHDEPAPADERDWLALLRPFYDREGLTPPPRPGRRAARSTPRRRRRSRRCDPRSSPFTSACLLPPCVIAYVRPGR